MARRPIHNYHRLNRVLADVELDTIDHRSKVGIALRLVTQDLVGQLGGKAAVSAAQAILIRQIAVKTVIAESVSDWLLTRPSLIVGDRLLDVVGRHDSLQGTLTRMLQALGLEHRVTPTDVGQLCVLAEDARPSRQDARRDAPEPIVDGSSLRTRLATSAGPRTRRDARRGGRPSSR